MNTVTISKSNLIEDKKILNSSIAFARDREKKEMSWFERNAKFVEDNIFAVASIMIMVQTMWGGITVAIIVEHLNDILVLGTSAAVTMGLNVAFLGQASAKWCLGMFLTSISLNTFLIIYCMLG